jgi:hypothetical protein
LPTLLSTRNNANTRAAQILVANKAVLFDSLAAAGIENVVVTFDGYGDSGQIEAIDAGVGEESTSLPTDRIEIARTTWRSPDIQRQTQLVRRVEADHGGLPSSRAAPSRRRHMAGRSHFWPNHHPVIRSRDPDAPGR